MQIPVNALNRKIPVAGRRGGVVDARDGVGKLGDAGDDTRDVGEPLAHRRHQLVGGDAPTGRFHRGEGAVHLCDRGAEGCRRFGEVAVGVRGARAVRGDRGAGGVERQGPAVGSAGDE